MAGLTFQVYDGKFMAALHDYAQRVKKDARTVLTDQARLLAEELMADTPPFASGEFEGYKPRMRDVGRAAVERDIKNAVRLFDTSEMPAFSHDATRKSRDMWVSRWQALAAKGDLAGLQALASNSKMLRGYTVVKFDGPTQHQAIRDPRGHVNRRRMVVAYEVNNYRSYVAMMKRRVGYHKTQLRPALEALGSKKIPAWIKAFPVADGSIDMTRMRANNPSLVIAMHNVKIPQYEERYIARALRNRRVRMDSRLKNLASRGLL